MLGKAGLMSLLLDIKLKVLKCQETIYNIDEKVENVYFIRTGEVELQKEILVEDE